MNDGWKWRGWGLSKQALKIINDRKRKDRLNILQQRTSKPLPQWKVAR